MDKRTSNRHMDGTELTEVQLANCTKARLALVELTSDERWTVIALAAYFRAEKRGFAPGGELQDWLEAEREIFA